LRRDPFCSVYRTQRQNIASQPRFANRRNQAAAFFGPDESRSNIARLFLQIAFHVIGDQNRLSRKTRFSKVKSSSTTRRETEGFHGQAIGYDLSDRPRTRGAHQVQAQRHQQHVIAAGMDAVFGPMRAP
jgi:hypothetical protein